MCIRDRVYTVLYLSCNRKVPLNTHTLIQFYFISYVTETSINAITSFKIVCETFARSFQFIPEDSLYSHKIFFTDHVCKVA